MAASSNIHCSEMKPSPPTLTMRLPKRRLPNATAQPQPPAGTAVPSANFTTTGAHDDMGAAASSGSGRRSGRRRERQPSTFTSLLRRCLCLPEKPTQRQRRPLALRGKGSRKAERDRRGGTGKATAEEKESLTGGRGRSVRHAPQAEMSKPLRRAAVKASTPALARMPSRPREHSCLDRRSAATTIRACRSPSTLRFGATPFRISRGLTHRSETRSVRCWTSGRQRATRR